MSPKTLALASTAVLLAAILLAAIATAFALDVAATFIGGLGFVGLLASAFLAIGLSEDRARERDSTGPSR